MMRDGHPMPALNAIAYGIGTAKSVPSRKTESKKKSKCKKR